MPSEVDDERALSTFFERYVSDGKPGGSHFAMRNPAMTIDALRRLRRMPATVYTPSAGPEATAVLDALTNRPAWRALRGAVSTLHVPADPAAYIEGSSKQTLRRKIRAAQAAGVTWRRVDDLEERVLLMRRADEYERSHPREQYRNRNADNADLLGIRLWLGAFGADGQPLMLSVTPTDGEWGALRYFRTFSTDPAATNARYLMSKVLVDHLVPLGVRRVVDTVHPIHLPNGLRHFQRMVGYRVEHVRFPAPREGRAPSRRLGRGFDSRRAGSARTSDRVFVDDRADTASMKSF